MANTTSSSYSFDQDFSIDEIIADAYERLGLVGTAGHQLKTARRSLNILFQEWGNRGIHFWEVGNTNINLVAGSTTNVDATAEGSGVYTFYRNSTDVPGGGEPPQATTVPTTNVFGISDILNVTFRQNYNDVMGYKILNPICITKMSKLKTLNIDNKKFSSKDLEIIKKITTGKRDKFLNEKKKKDKSIKNEYSLSEKDKKTYDKLDKEINFGSPYTDYAYDQIQDILKERKKKTKK